MNIDIKNLFKPIKLFSRLKANIDNSDNIVDVYNDLKKNKMFRRYGIYRLKKIAVKVFRLNTRNIPILTSSINKSKLIFHVEPKYLNSISDIHADMKNIDVYINNTLWSSGVIVAFNYNLIYIQCSTNITCISLPSPVPTHFTY